MNDATTTKKLRLLVLAVNLAALAALAAQPVAGLREHLAAAGLIAALAFVAGIRPVHIPSLRLEMTPTHPLILIALALQGPMVAAIAGVSGVLGATCGRRPRTAPIRLIFNLGAVLLATFTASWAFVAAGGRPGGDIAQLLWPLAGATTLFFIVNSGLVSSAIALEKRQPLVRVWLGTFNWTASSYFAGFTLAVVILMLMRSFGAWGIILSFPPCWMLVSFYREHKARLAESKKRYEEVAALNGRLDATVQELREALDHVKQLQGLLPICMHCKRIRDDKNIWHRLEEYITQHADVTFTHALCEKCRDEHYHEITALR
jgi:hypothetical protein